MLLIFTRTLTQSDDGLSVTTASLQPPAVHQTVSTTDPRTVSAAATIQCTAHNYTHHTSIIMTQVASVIKRLQNKNKHYV